MSGKTGDKMRFIELRAKGSTYKEIARKLKISPSTITVWGNELSEQIAERKAEYLEELYRSYYMLREHRIKTLGETFTKINTELESRKLSEVPTDKLMDYQIKYLKELKAEYIDLPGSKTNENLNGNELLREFVSLLNRTRAGEITPEQATKENFILINLLKAYEVVEVDQKLDSINSILGGRKNEKHKF